MKVELGEPNRNLVRAQLGASYRSYAMGAMQYGKDWKFNWERLAGFELWESFHVIRQ